MVGHGCVETRTPDGRSLGVPTGARVALRGLMRGLSVDPLPMNVAGWRVFSELTPDLWVRIVAAAMQLALALGAARLRTPSALRWPFVLLCVAVFLTELGGVAHVVTHQRAFHLVDHAAAPFAGAAAIHFVVMFVGRRRRLGSVVVAAYLGFGALSVAALAGVSSGPERGTWALVFLAGLFVVVATGSVLLVRHLRSARADERRHTWRVLVALVGGLSFGATELANDFLPFRGMSDVGAILATVLLAPLLLEPSPLSTTGARALRLAQWFAFAIVAVSFYLGIFRAVEGHTLAIALACSSLTLLAGLLVLRALQQSALMTARRSRLLWAGRLSEQLAHDLQNPLAAVHGAAQFLLEERRQQRSLDDHEAMVQLMLDQTRRMRELLVRYRRLAEVELDREPVDLRALAGTVVGASRRRFPSLRFEDPNASATRMDLCVQGDGDLLAVALEGVVVNAAEASTSGQRVSVTLCAEGDSVQVVVTDQGTGMDERTREQAFDEYFTTKAEGSGLGLAFARRVVEAHGGSISLDDGNGGVGTSVSLTLPREAAPT